MTLEEIAKDWLKTHNYDGLVSPSGDCACELSDLIPCREPGVFCEAGVKVKCDPETCEVGGKCDWHIAPKGMCAHGMAQNCRQCREERRARDE